MPGERLATVTFFICYVDISQSLSPQSCSIQSVRQGKLVKTIGLNQPQASNGPLMCPLSSSAKLLSRASCYLPLDLPHLSLCLHPPSLWAFAPADPSARNDFPTPEGILPLLQARASPPLLLPSPGAPGDFRFSVLACLPSPRPPHWPSKS